MSSFSSVVPQSRAHVSVLSKLISAESVHTRLWLRGEIVRLVDPMLDALFLRLIMSPGSAEHQHSLTVSELCQLIEGQKKETNRLVRSEMDRLVNSLFLKLTKKLLVNMDWNESRNVGDRSLVVNPSDHVESSNTESHQPVHIPQPLTFNPYLQQPHSNGVEEEFKILTGVKREIEDGENEVELEKIPDNATQANQFDTGLSSTDDHHLFCQMDATLRDGHLSNQPISDDHQDKGQMNNDIQDCDEPEIKEDGDDEQMIQIEVEDEEEIVDGTDHEGEVGDDETEIDSDNDEEDEDSQNEESSRLIASPLDKTSPPNQSPIRRQSARNVKRKQTEDQRQKQMANWDSKEDDEEEGEVAEEVTSRSVKRHRSSRYTISSRTEEKQIISQSSAKIATECTTNPIQPNRHLQCSHCHKSFKHQSKLHAHLRVHTGERPFQCDLCDKRFSKKFNLTQHLLIHQNIKRFRCHECDTQFTLKLHLDSHLRTHSGERPFECRHCDKSFTSVGNRIKHERAIHLHVKPYRCKQCGHTATTQSHIIAHIRMVHFGLPRSIKEQQTLNIIDDRDPRELVEKVLLVSDSFDSMNTDSINLHK